jgi:hypothetical protein
MAITLSPKPSAATYFGSWKPDLVEGDAISSFTLTETGVVIESSENASDEIKFYVSGGTTGQVHTIAASATTGYGETLVETIYVPISGPDNAFATTAGEVVDFALRPVRGLLGSSTSAEKADALEHLNDMLAEWALTGADMGIPLPLVEASVLYCSDAYVRAIKNNLRVQVAEQYSQQASSVTVRAALQGLQTIKFDLRDREPLVVGYF